MEFQILVKFLFFQKPSFYVISFFSLLFLHFTQKIHYFFLQYKPLTLDQIHHLYFSIFILDLIFLL